MQFTSGPRRGWSTLHIPCHFTCKDVAGAVSSVCEWPCDVRGGCLRFDALNTDGVCPFQTGVIFLSTPLFTPWRPPAPPPSQLSVPRQEILNPRKKEEVEVDGQVPGRKGGSSNKPHGKINFYYSK